MRVGDKMLDKLTTIDIIDFTDRLRGSFAREKVSYHQTAGLGPTRIGGIVATQAWTAAGPQADDRRNGFHHHVADQRTQPDFRRAGAPDQGKVRRDRTSPQYRTPIGAPGKKTSLSAADTYDTSRTRNLAADYEPLRTQVLAGQHHGHGLSILV